MDDYIFVVGKIAASSHTIYEARQMGYKIGIFHDSKSSHVASKDFDNIVSIDFSDIGSELPGLARLRPVVKGLVCTYENYITAHSQLGSFFGVDTLSQMSAQATTDKILMREKFVSHDSSTSPAFSQIKSYEDAQSFAYKYGYPLIIKPANLVKSLLVMRCNNAVELEANVAQAFEQVDALYKKNHIYGREPKLLIEEFIEGQMFSVAAFVDSKGVTHFCPGICELTTAQSRGSDDNYLYKRALPATLDKSLAEELHHVARQGVAALEMSSSPAHIELIHGKSGVKLVEIGARIGGYRPRMYQTGYEISLDSAEINNAIGSKLNMNANLKRHVAVFELFPQIIGEFSHIQNEPDDIKAITDYYVVKFFPGDTVGPAKDGYRAVAICIVSHENSTEFERRCDIIDQLKVEVNT